MKRIFTLKPFQYFLLLVFMLMNGQAILGATITSTRTGNWTSSSTWVGGIVPVPGDNVIIASGHTVTTGAVTRNAGTTTEVNGTLKATGQITLTGITLTVNGTYEHNFDGGTIPTAVWSSGSTCNITGVVATIPSGILQTFYNLTWNCPSQTVAPTTGLYTTTTTVLTLTSNDLTITSTGTGSLLLTSGGSKNILLGGKYIQNGGTVLMSLGTSSNASSLTVNSDFEISGGTFELTDNGGGFNSSGRGLLIVKGNFYLFGGTFDLANTGNNAVAGSAITLTGDFNQDGGTFKYTNPQLTATNNAFTFNKIGTQLFNIQAGTFSATNLSFAVSAATSPTATTLKLASDISVVSGTLTVNNGATLEIPAAYKTTGSGSTVIAAGGTLKIANTLGITATGATGAVQTTTRTYNSTGKYEYNGTTAQVTGLGLPTTLTGVGNLNINNNAGVTLTRTTTATTGTVTLTNGYLTTATATILSITNTVAAAITSANFAYINGPLRRTLFNTTRTYLFPVGKGGVYLPFTINSYTSGTTQAPTVEAYNAGSGGSSSSGSVSATEYWKVIYSVNAFSNPIIKLQKATNIYSNALVGGTGATANGSYTSFGGSFPSESLSTILAASADNLAISGATRHYAIITPPLFASITSGNWNSASTWMNNQVPTASDNVFIDANHTVTIPDGTTASCNKLTKTSGSNGELAVIGDLTVADNIEMPSSTTNDGLLTISGTGTIAVTGSMVLGSNVDKQTDTDTDIIISGALTNITTNDVSIYANRKTGDTGIFEENIFTVSDSKFTVNNQIIVTTEASRAVATFTNRATGTPGGRIVLKGATPLAVGSGGGTEGFAFTGGDDYDENNPEATGYVSFDRGSSQTLRTLSATNVFFKNASNSGTITVSKLCKLISGNVSSTIALGDGATIDRSGGTYSGLLGYPSGIGKYILKYSQTGSTITAGQEFRTFETNRISKIILANTNGINLNTINYTVPEVVATSSTSLTNGVLTVTNILDAQTSGTFDTGGCIILKSDATNTARVPNLTQNPTITGNVKVERYIQNLDNDNNSAVNRTWQLLTAPLKGNSANTVFENWQENGTRDNNARYGVEIWGPVDNQANNGLKFITNSSYNLRRYQNVGGVWKFVNVENTKTEPLFTSTINKGFLVFATAPYDWEGMADGNLPDYSKRELTLRASGTLITGNVVYSSVPSVGNGYALIGNPYASPINILSILNDSDNSSLSRKIWVIDPSIGNFGAYNIWNDGLWSNVTGGYNNSRVELQSGQAFFVQATTETGSLTIKESHKGTDVNSADIFNRTAQAKDDLVRVNLYAEDAASSTWKNRDACVARFYNGANNLIDTKDVQKFSNPSENISFVYGSANYTVDHRAPILNGDILNLRISSTVANTSYKLRIYTEDFVTYDGTAYLEDLFTNTKTEVALDGGIVDYPFSVTTAPTSTGNRFRIVFAEKVLGVNKVDENRGVTVFPNPTNGEGVSVNLGILSNTNYNYRLVNVLGQTIQDGTFIKENDNQDVYITFNKKMTKGWYALEITDANNKAITKPIIIE